MIISLGQTIPIIRLHPPIDCHFCRPKLCRRLADKLTEVWQNRELIPVVLVYKESKSD